MSERSNRLVAQIPSIVGDIAGNRDGLRKARAEAAAFGANLVLTPELFLAGYPPEDLVLPLGGPPAPPIEPLRPSLAG
jgi:NAD+ synthase